MSNRRCFSQVAGVLSALAVVFSGSSAYAVSVGVQPLETGPTPVGVPVIWNAWSEDGMEGAVWYRYRIRLPGSAQFRTVRDFSLQNSFQWVPTMMEGVYEIEVTARNVDSGQSSSTVIPYEVISRVTGSEPVITPTSNELVFLYSAPPCQPGSRISVGFTAPQGARQFTPLMDCIEGKSINAYLAGFRADTDYTVQHTIRAADGALTQGPAMRLRTGPLSFSPAITRPVQQPGAIDRQSILVQNRLFERSLATDAEGQVIWYFPESLQYLTRFERGGYFFALIEDENAADSGQLLRQLDLAGNIVLETNAASINQQLEARGLNKITSFHHEARRLPDGNILVLAASERMMTDVQGSDVVDIIGDTILVLNRDLEIVWVWDSFDHLDVNRKAILDEKCIPGAGGCPVFRLAPIANDWLHGNSLSLTPDGHIIYSARHQDWIIKIDYANGNGSGQVLWRLGKDGDFRIIADDPNPWFSHQHDANFERNGGASRLVVFDNGNIRRATDPNANSRGQVLEVDESTLTATLSLNADLGEYAAALGSAQKLTNGNYFFDVGWTPSGFSRAVEFDASGNLVSHFEVETQQYRSFRMRDLYTP